MEELGSQLNSEKFPDARQRRFPGKVAQLAQGGFVGCLVGFSRERERERRKFPWPRGLSSASRIEKCLSPPLPPSRFLFLFGRFHGCCMATRWRSANFNDLFRGQAQPPEIRQSTLHGFCIPSSSRSLSLVVKFDDSGKEGREDFFFFLLFETTFPFFFPYFLGGGGVKITGE